MSWFNRIEWGSGNLLKLSVWENILLTMERMRNKEKPGKVRENPLAYLGIPMDAFRRTVDTDNFIDEYNPGGAIQWEEMMEFDNQLFREIVEMIKNQMDPQIWRHYHPGETPEQIVHRLYNNGGIDTLPAWWRVNSEYLWEMHKDELIVGEVPIAMSTTIDYGKPDSRVSGGAWVGSKPLILVSDDRDITDELAVSFAVAMANQTEDTFGLVITATGQSERNGSVMIEPASGDHTLKCVSSCIVGGEKYRDKRVIFVESLDECADRNSALPRMLGVVGQQGERTGEVGLMCTMGSADFLTWSQGSNVQRKFLNSANIVVGGLLDVDTPIRLARTCAEQRGMDVSSLAELFLKIERRQLAIVAGEKASIVWQLG